MKLYSTLTIGEFHTNNCEDFLINEQISDNQRLIAVLDGCSMGIESVFASHLYGKILRKIAKQQFYKEFVTTNNLILKQKLKLVIKTLITETKQLKNQLDLNTNELLSTIIIGIIDVTECKAEFIAIGDGLICIDGELIEYEHNDKPDYLGYHLQDDFETWFNSQKQLASVSKFNDLSICTDGIFTFKNFKDKSKQKTEKEILDYLLVDVSNMNYNNGLDRKLRILKDNYNHIVTDDLAIIRIIGS
jgi:hypothetical protein